MPRNCGTVWINLVTLVALLIPLQSDTRAQESIRFRSGKAFETALQDKIRLSSISMSLDAQLSDLSQSAGIAIHRDRRTDPRSPISLETGFASRVQVLLQISQTIPSTSICVHKNLIVIGPQQAVHRLPVLIDQAERAVSELNRNRDPASRSASQRVNPSWDQLAEPRQFLREAAIKSGISISNLELIPHDVWAAGNLPAMSVAEFLAIILNEFDLRVQADTSFKSLQIVPIRTDDSFELRYSTETTPDEMLETRLQTALPKASIKWSKSNARVTATVEEHAQFHEILTSLKYSEDSRGGNQTPAKMSLRHMAFQLQEGRMTTGQLIENLRRQNINIEVLNPETPETKTILSQIVKIETMTKPIAGNEFFKMLFQSQFKSIEVLDDRVVLSFE